MTKSTSEESVNLPSTMQAVVVTEYGDLDAVAVASVPLPVPGKDELLVRTEFAGVNYADGLVIAGKYQVRPDVPFSPGKELVGKVVGIGERVKNFKLNQAVTARVEYGAWREYANVTADCCSIIPEGVPMRDATALGVTYQSAWFALHQRGHFAPGQSVLITGAAGGVGLAAVELVAALGGIAIAGVRHENQHDLVRDHGAAHVVDLSRDDLRNSIKEEIMQFTDGNGVDIVLDNVGGDVFHACLRAIAWSGHVVVIGFAGGEIPVVKAGLLLVKNITVAGLQWSDYRDRQPQLVDQVQTELWQLYKQKKIQPALSDQFALADFKLALQRLAKGHLAGQVLLAVTGSVGH